MSKHTSTALLFMLGCFVASCSSPSPPQKTTKPVSPVSYGKYEGHSAKSVGLLRRLVLLPPRFECRFGNKIDQQETEDQLAVFGPLGGELLREERGYDVQDWPADVAMLPKEFFTWADTATIDSIPPLEWATQIRTLALRQNADGVVVLQGFQQYPSKSYGPLVVGTGLIGWSVLAVNITGEISISIFEGSSGRLIFRKRSSLHETGAPIMHNVDRNSIHRLLLPMETAVPSILTAR